MFTSLLRGLPRFGLPVSFNCAVAFCLTLGLRAATESPTPLGPPGIRASYRLADPVPGQTSVVQRLTITLGKVETDGGTARQWIQLAAAREQAPPFAVWLLSGAWPSDDLKAAAGQVSRYLLREGSEAPLEFTDRFTRAAVLPGTGAWPHLLPRPTSGAFKEGVVAEQVRWLGRTYLFERRERSANAEGAPPEAQRLDLLPDVLVGVPSNRRTTDDRRRYDRSDYPTARLTRGDFDEMIRAGLNCFHVDREQAAWLRREPVFIWGESPAEVRYPECLFRSTWLGPALFLDEPAVGTRDYIIRPKLTNEVTLRRTITPQFALSEFTNHYREVIEKGAPWNLLNGLRARADAGIGTMHFPQRNLYVWETMADTAAWELSAGGEAGPCAYVFEPPGRVGAQRTLPEMNMVYGCQIPPGDAGNFFGIVTGFARGAARATGKDWGVSIYGGVDQQDSPVWFTRAYDLGARYFFFWDNYELACVPYGEILALARQLQAHVASHPVRDLPRLRRGAETAILLPPGYGLGHVHMGRGNLWGLPELNLERTNRFGVTHRAVMRNFFTEIERCIRHGTAFDLLWELDGLKLDGYLEVVRCREDGRVALQRGGTTTLLEHARIPERPEGTPPGLEIEIRSLAGIPPRPYAHATITEGSAPVFYTMGADKDGVHQNVQVLWELFGPAPEDYRPLLWGTGAKPWINPTVTGSTVEVDLGFAKPGHYRLRAATTDLAGRSTVAWKEINIRAFP